MLALQDDMDCSHCVTYDGPQVPAASGTILQQGKLIMRRVVCVCTYSNLRCLVRFPKYFHVSLTLLEKNILFKCHSLCEKDFCLP